MKKANKSKKPISLQAKILFCLVFIAFLVYSFTLIYPFIWTFFNSLKTNPGYWENMYNIPTEPQWGNYVRMFSELKAPKSNPLYYTNYLEMLFNSIYLTGTAALISTLASTMLAYALNKYRFKGSSIIYAVAVFTMIIPVVGNLPAQYKLRHAIGLINTPLTPWVSWSGYGMHMIVMYGFLSGVSWNYAEAAFIDGASNWNVFLKIMLPQVRPAFVSLFILHFIAGWNSYLGNLLFNIDYATLSTGLFIFKNSGASANNTPVYYAALLMSTLPMVALFIAFQDTIMKNMVAGGLKG